MSEQFLKLDPNNYDIELDYLLDNHIFEFEDYKSFFESGKITKEDFEKVKDFYGCLQHKRDQFNGRYARVYFEDIFRTLQLC